MLDIRLSKLLGQIGQPATRVDSVDLSKRRLAKQHAEQGSRDDTPFSHSNLQAQGQSLPPAGSLPLAANSSCLHTGLRHTSGSTCQHSNGDQLTLDKASDILPASQPARQSAHAGSLDTILAGLPSELALQDSATATTAAEAAAAAAAAAAADDGYSEASSVPLDATCGARTDSLTLARARGVAEHPRALQRRMASSPPPATTGRKSSGSVSEAMLSPLRGGSSRKLRKGKKAASCDASQLAAASRRCGSESEGSLRRRGSEGGWHGGQGFITLLKRGFQTFASELQQIGTLHHSSGVSGDERDQSTSATSPSALTQAGNYKSRPTSASASQHHTRSSPTHSTGQQHSLKQRKSWNGDVRGRERAHSVGAPAAAKRVPSCGNGSSGGGGGNDSHLHTPRWFARLSVGKSRRGSADSTRHSSFTRVASGCIGGGGCDTAGLLDIDSPPAPSAAADAARSAASPAAGKPAAGKPAADVLAAGAVAEAQLLGHSSASTASASATAAAFMSALHSRAAGSMHGRGSECGQLFGQPVLRTISSSQRLLLAL